uniref:Uncharacterized protein n=1 Tax=Acrobeloides nanus TaxID=290746 RepID=A0A914E270_9BILA
MSSQDQYPIKRVRVGSFETPTPGVPLITNVPLHTSDGRVIDSTVSDARVLDSNNDEYDMTIEQPEDEHKGILDNLKETVVELKDKITGNTPAKKAYHNEVKYAKKELKELKKEHKYMEEAEVYAEKGAKKASKYAMKAEKFLEKERAAAEKAAKYHQKAHDNEARLHECRDAHILRAAELMHDAESRLQEAH